jgi:hypothetical protein
MLSPRAASTVEQGGGLLRMSGALLKGTLPALAKDVVPSLMFDKAVMLSPAVAKKICKHTDAVACVVIEVSPYPSGRFNVLPPGDNGAAAILLLQEPEGSYVLHAVEMTLLHKVADLVTAEMARPLRSSSVARVTSGTPTRTPTMPVQGRKHDLAVWASDCGSVLMRSGAVEKPLGQGGLGIAAAALRLDGVYTAVGTPASRRVAELERLDESVAVSARVLRVLSVRASRASATSEASEAEVRADPDPPYVPLGESGGGGVVSPPRGSLNGSPVSSRRSGRSAASEAASLARTNQTIALQEAGVPPEAVAVMLEQNVTAALARELGQDKLIGLLESKAVRLSAFSTAQLATFFAATPPPTAPPALAAAAAAAQLAAAATAAPPLSMPILPGREGAEALPKFLAPPAGMGEATEIDAAVKAAAAAAAAADAAAAQVARLQAAQRDGRVAQSPAASALCIPPPPLELLVGQQLPLVTSARGLLCWKTAFDMEGALRDLLLNVPMPEMEATVIAMAALFDASKCLLSEKGWRGDMMVALLQPQVTLAFQSVSTTAAGALDAVTRHLAPSTRAILALSSVCAPGNAAPRGGGYVRGSEAASTGPPDAVRKAVERLGAKPGGRDLVTKLEGLAAGSAADEAASSAFRQAVSAGELDPEFGAHLSMLLHQEKMSKAPSGERNFTSNASSVWVSVVEVRAQLAAARVRAYRDLLPKAVDKLAFVTATNCFKLSLEVVCGAKKLQSLQPEEARLAAARAWPVLIALARECHPREAADVELGLLRVSSDAFDRTDTAENMLKNVTPVFEKMALLYDEYTTSGCIGTPPSWSTARKDSTLFDSEDARLDYYLNRVGPAAQGKPFVANSSFAAGVVDLGAGAGRAQAAAAAAAAATAKAAAAARVQAVADKKAADAAAAKAAK